MSGDDAHPHETTEARVLLLADDGDVREMLCLVFRDAGYEVESVASVEDASQRLQHRPLPRALVLDLVRLTPEAWSFCEALARDRALVQMRVIVLTVGAARARDARFARTLVLPKSTPMAELLATIEAAA